MKSWRLSAFGLVWLLAYPSPGIAQSKVTLENLYVDFAVPDLPALSLLGMNPNKVSRPGTLKELSVSVFPLAGSDATIGPGLAFAWAPVYTFANSIDHYRKPVLRRISISLVTAKEGTTSAVNAGIGARFTVYDGADPVLSQDYEERVLAILASNDVATRVSQVFQQDEARPVLEKIAAKVAGGDQVLAFKLIAQWLSAWDTRGASPVPFTAAAKTESFIKLVLVTAAKESLPTPEPSEFQDAIGRLSALYLLQVVTTASTMKTQLAKLDKEFRESHWNAPVVSIDTGLSGQSASGKWGDLTNRQFGGLIAGAFPTGSRGQLVVQFQGRKGAGADPPERSHVAGGARWLVGTSTKRFSAEIFTTSTDSTHASKDGTSRRFTLGSEFRLAQGFWVEAAFGSERRPNDDGWQPLSFANFKYAFKSGPRFTQIPGSVEDE